MKKKDLMLLLEIYSDNDNIDFTTIWDDSDLKSLISMWYIRKQKHPTLPLYIYNYTEKCQYERKWNEHTLSHRWLIKDESWNIVARSFPKFFNYEELSGKMKRKILWNIETFKVAEKLDGSLLIVFFYDWQWHTATKWSFESEQSIKGLELAQDLLENMDEAYTYLFEVIYPENKIVVEYKWERLVFLARVDIDWNIDHCWDYMPDKFISYGDLTIDDIVKLQDEDTANAEWYVCYNGNNMFKVKLKTYIEMHKTRFDYTKEKVFELIKEWERDFSYLPDELHKEVFDMIKYYKEEYSRVRDECKILRSTYNWDRTIFVDNIYASILFAWLDFRDISPHINNFITLPREDENNFT